MPDGFREGVTGLVNAATGEPDGGYRRITAEGEAVDRKIRETYEEVEAIAAEYVAARWRGLALGRRRIELDVERSCARKLAAVGFV
jgi:hypothetical protein